MFGKLSQSKRPFIWHGEQHEFDAPGKSSLGYLAVSFPEELSKANRRFLHALGAVTGLECVSTGTQAARRIRFGYDLDCGVEAELNLLDNGEMSVADLCAILNANFGMQLSEEDIT